MTHQSILEVKYDIVGQVIIDQITEVKSRQCMLRMIYNFIISLYLTVRSYLIY
jgi:hypothetical protein